jgi:hypothetical protein
MLIKCPECESVASDQADFCPRCGYKLGMDVEHPDFEPAAWNAVFNKYDMFVRGSVFDKLGSVVLVGAVFLGVLFLVWIGFLVVELFG